MSPESHNCTFSPKLAVVETVPQVLPLIYLDKRGKQMVRVLLMLIY
jgi:hypothetical protein